MTLTIIWGLLKSQRDGQKVNNQRKSKYVETESQKAKM